MSYESKDSDRLVWLVQRLTYLEHINAQGVPAVKAIKGGYWPQSDDDHAEAFVPELVGLPLIAYIDAMIAHETGEAA